MTLLRVAVPNRHITGVILQLISKAGWTWDTPAKRQLSFVTHDNQLYILIVKAHDIPHMVANHVFDLGFVQASVVREEGCPLKIIKDLPIALGKMVVGVPEGMSITSVKDLQGKRLATRNPNLTGQFLKEHQIDCVLLEVRGSPEAYANSGAADAVFVYWKTGQTLQDNGLRKVADVCSSNLQLVTAVDHSGGEKIMSVVNRVAHYLENHPIPDGWRFA